jgi:hypothetical protein
MVLDQLNEELTTVLTDASQQFHTPAKTSSSGFEVAMQSAKSPEPKSALSFGEDGQRISVMDNLFRGELSTSITCGRCHKVSEKTEKFYYLSVPLPQEVH